MAIWFKNCNLDDVKKRVEKNMLAHVGIDFTEIGDDFIKAKMPVDHRTQQPYGLLHGGASCVLAESLGSIASNLCLDSDKQYGVGIEINANHLRSITQGNVIGIVKPIHIGRTTHVWDIRIHSEADDKLICISRLTVKVLDKG